MNMKKTDILDINPLIKPDLIITRGISNSGKSTWAVKWVKGDPENRRRSNRDSFRESALNIATYDISEESLITEMQHRFIALHLKAGRSVVVDDLNLRAKYVRELYFLAKDNNANFVVKPFPITLDKALARAEKRADEGGLYVSPEAIKDMHDKFTKNGVPNALPDFSKPIKGEGGKDLRKRILKDALPYVADTSKPKAIIVDMDGTLTVGIHPDRGPYDWAKVGLDIINEPVADIVRIMKGKGYLVLITSGRDGSCRFETIEWLNRHEIPWDQLFMRGTGDMAGDDVVKLEIFDRLIRDEYNVRAVFDDRLKVVRAWHSLGLPLFRVGDPDADF